MDMPRIGFRSTTVADESAIMALLQAAHVAPPAHPTFEHRHLCWKYWEPCQGWQGSRSYVLTRDGQILAHAAVVPAVYAWGSGHLKLLCVIDWAARPDARGAGVAIMQRLGDLADVIVTWTGTDTALLLLPFMGFKESGTLVTRYARPIRPLRYLSSPAEEPKWRATLRCLRNALWALEAPSNGGGSRHARAIAAEDVATTPIPWPAPKYGSAVLERTAATMGHRLRCPAVPMELYAVEDAGGTEGYFVLAFVPGQARLVDCWLDCADPRGWEALVRLAVQEARRHRDVAEVATVCSEPLLARALQRCGFHARGSRPLLLRAAREVRVPDLPMRIQLLDDDQAYIGAGGLLWA